MRKTDMDINALLLAIIGVASLVAASSRAGA